MLWTRKLARERRPTPPGFLETCQPTLASAPPAGPGWLHEVKHDGYRLIARADQDGARVRLWSRNANDFTLHFTGIAEAVSRIGIDCVLDGEAVAFHADGHSDFQALKNSEASSGATLVAFDVLEVEGFDFRSQPLERRRAMLTELLTPIPHGIVLSETIEGNGATLFRHACGMGLEGIVSKRLGSKYRAGRTADWVNTKNPGWVRR
jgi:bifunctional non-homologous end joining protein LigD